MPSTVRAQAWEQLGLPSVRCPSTKGRGSMTPRPRSSTACSAVVGHGGDGDDAAVVEALPAGAEGAVDEDAVAGGVAAFALVPGRAGEFGAVDVPGGAEAAPDAVGEVFAVGVGDGEGHDAGGAVGGDVGGGGVGEGFPGGVG